MPAQEIVRWCALIIGAGVLLFVMVWSVRWGIRENRRSIDDLRHAAWDYFRKTGKCPICAFDLWCRENSYSQVLPNDEHPCPDKDPAVRENYFQLLRELLQLKPEEPPCP